MPGKICFVPRPAIARAFFFSDFRARSFGTCVALSKVDDAHARSVMLIAF